MVKVILRSLVFRNPTQVQLIHGDPRYKQMSPEEVIGKFVSFELMIKDSKHIVNLEQGATSTPEVQPVAFKVTEEKKEVGMTVGRILFGYNNTQPEIIPEASTNIHTHQTNRARNCTCSRVHRVSTGYRVSSGYVIVD
jgi:hypothetical protein